MNKKLFWAVMLWIFGMLVYPIFWFKYIRKNGESGDETYAYQKAYQENAETYYEASSYPQNRDIYYEVKDNTVFYSHPMGTTQRESYKTEKERKCKWSGKSKSALRLKYKNIDLVGKRNK